MPVPDLPILVLMTSMILLWFSSPTEALLWYFILCDTIYPGAYVDLWWAFFLWYLVVVLFARRFIPQSLKVV